MDEEKFGAVANFNSNRQQLEKIKKALEEKNSPEKEADLKLVAEESGEKEIKKSAGADINKNPDSPEKAEKPDSRQAILEKRIREILPGIFSAEAIDESINANIASDKKAKKTREIIGLVKNDLNSVAKDPKWYKLKWRDDELKNALKRHFIKKATNYFNAERLTGIKKFHNYLEGLCKVEKREQKEQKKWPLHEEKKEFLENLGKELEKGVLEKLNENDKEILNQNPVKEKEFVKLRRVTPLAKKAIYEIREAFQKNKDLREEDVAGLLQKGTLKHLSPRERDLAMVDFERLVKSKKDQEGKFSQETKKKEIKKTKISRRSQLAEDEAKGKLEFSGKYYTGAGAPEDARKESIKLKNGKKVEGRKEQEKIPQKPERTKKDIIAGIKAAAEVGDEEQMAKLERELEDFDKTGEQLFEEAQAIEAEQKFKEAQEESLEKEPKPAEEKPDLSTREKIDADIKSQKSDYEAFVEEIDEKPDLSTPEGRAKQIRFTESDEQKFAREIDAQERAEKEKAEQGNVKLEQLKLELEQARREYLEVDYKKKKTWKRMADFFGKFIKADEKPGNNEILHYKDIYLNKLFEYKDAILEDAKTRGASNKELGDLVKLFGVEVNCNLADVRDQVKMENQEGKILGRFTKHSKNIIDWYNKLPRYKKIAIGAAFGLTAAAGAGAGGAALAGTMGVAVSARRIFMGAVTGTSVALGAEAFLRRRTEKGIESGAEAITEQFNKLENLSLEEKLKLVDEKVKMLVGDVDEKIARHKKTKLAAASLGILAGTIIGSGALSELGKVGWHKISDFFGMAEHHPGGIGAPKAPTAPEAPEAAPAVDVLTVKEGGSLEKVIAKYFEDHPDLIEKYGELHGHRNFNPGQIAHRMYLDYLHENANPLNKSLDLVYPEAEIEIDPAALRISEFADTKGAIGRAIEQAAGNHEKWAGMKNLSLKELAGAAKNKIASLSGEYGKFWGPEAEVRSGEKIKDWLARVVRLAAEKK